MCAVSPGLSKPSDCTPHDLLVTKRDACDFIWYCSLHLLIFGKQEAICQNKYYSKLPWRYHISCSPGIILDSIIYTLFFNDFFYFILLATAQSFVDDNTLAFFSKTIQELIGSLESETEIALNCFNENKMIINPGKFPAIIIYKRKQDDTNEIFKIGSKEIKVASQVKLLGVEIDNKLNFEQCINGICKSAAKQLNALIRLKRSLGFQERKALVNSFVL